MICWNSQFLVNSWKAAFAYCGPLSLLSTSGMPCLAKISFILLTTAAVVAPLGGIFCTKNIFDYMSAMTMYCTPSKSKRSEATTDHGRSDLGCFTKGLLHYFAWNC